MIIETILFLVFIAVVGAAIVKLFEWRQDVLYGPYIDRPTGARPADQMGYLPPSLS
jgi:hypothetical protein